MDLESLWPQFQIFLSPEWTSSPPTCSPKYLKVWAQKEAICFGFAGLWKSSMHDHLLQQSQPHKQLDRLCQHLPHRVAHAPELPGRSVVWWGPSCSLLRPLRSVVLNVQKKFSCVPLTCNGPLWFYKMKHVYWVYHTIYLLFPYDTGNWGPDWKLHQKGFFFHSVTESLNHCRSFYTSWGQGELQSQWAPHSEMRWDEYTEQTITWSPVDIS